MDWGSLTGIGVALAGILFGQALDGGRLHSLFQPAAFMIVMMGTLGAILLQTRLSVFIKGIKMARLIFKPPMDDKPELTKRIIQWSIYSRKEGIFMLESHLRRETDPYIIKGLRLMIDGTAPEKIREIMAIDLYFYEMELRNAAKIWDAAGGYSPTVGILGAVLGLIHVMENLSDPSRLGSGIAVAFVATIYGVGFANLLFLPIGNKLKAYIQQEMKRREMLLNAWISIANGDHPRIVEERLEAYLK